MVRPHDAAGLLRSGTGSLHGGAPTRRLEPLPESTLRTGVKADHRAARTIAMRASSGSHPARRNYFRAIRDLDADTAG
jgi:hypothetical protein